MVSTKIREILLGGALGDALGAPHEFSSYRGEYTGNLQYDIQMNNRYYGKITLEVGSVTDDTQMTFELLRSFIRCEGEFSEEDIISSYIQWADRRHESLGRNTRALFRNIKTKDKMRTYRIRRRKVDPNNQSNGSLMRTGAMAFLPWNLSQDELEDIIRREVNLTNQHENNVRCSFLHVTLLRKIMKGKSLTHLTKYIRRFARNILEECSDLHDALLEAIHGDERDVTGRTKGWCVNSSYCSIFALLHSSGYKEGISKVIQMGGDTDTNAKITGDLLGGMYGVGEEDENIRIMMECWDNKDIFGDLDDVILQCEKMLMA